MKVNSSKVLLMFTLILSLLCSKVLAITGQEADLFAKQAYEKALTAQKANDIELASMYFINSLAFNPGRIDVISEYALMIIKQVNEDITLPTDTLDALDNFLNAQVMTVKPDDLPKIIELRSKISEAQEKISLRNAPFADNVDMYNANAEDQLKKYKNQAAKSKTLQEYINNLQSAQNLIEENNFNEPAITDEFQTAQMIDTMIKQIHELISRAEMKNLEPLQTYYLQIAENSFQQIMALSVKIPPTLFKELVSVKLYIEKSVNNVSDKRSEKAFKKIQKNFDLLKRTNQNTGSQQLKIDRINKFMQDSAVIAQEITSEKYNLELKKIMDSVQKSLMNYHSEQEKQYNIWAIKQINQMMQEADKHDRAIVKFKSRDSQNMRKVMDSCLSHIDTRLLNFGAQHCFNRIYEEYYSKLDDADQKELDKAMAYSAKRALTEF